MLNLDSAFCISSRWRRRQERRGRAGRGRRAGAARAQQGRRVRAQLGGVGAPGSQGIYPDNHEEGVQRAGRSETTSCS